MYLETMTVLHSVDIQASLGHSKSANHNILCRNTFRSQVALRARHIDKLSSPRIFQQHLRCNMILRDNLFCDIDMDKIVLLLIHLQLLFRFCKFLDLVLHSIRPRHNFSRSTNKPILCCYKARQTGCGNKHLP